MEVIVPTHRMPDAQTHEGCQTFSQLNQVDAFIQLSCVIYGRRIDKRTPASGSQTHVYSPRAMQLAAYAWYYA